MNWIDTVVLCSTLAFIVIFGYYQSRGSENINDFFRGGKKARWWTVGISVMATQASAVTFLSTPGQAFNDGMGFVQFYIGVPLAMILICMVFVPIYHRLNVYTAYEYLESRFDLKTRTLTAVIFLVQRSLAAGITIFAPSIVLSAVLGWDLLTLNIIIGSLVTLYTLIGGTKAVNVTQKQQMAVIFVGMIAAFFIILYSLPEQINFQDALSVAGASGKMDILDFSFNWDSRYTFWSGIIGGTFLALSYFGTDQSQVQRYLSASSVKQSQMGLIFNGLLKVPLQFFILLVGIMVFVFYQFNAAPLNFNPAAKEAVMNSEYAGEYEGLQKQLKKNQEKRASASLQLADAKTSNTHKATRLRSKLATLDSEQKELRKQGADLIEKSDGEVENNDKDYVFIHFVLNNFPTGFVGLLLAVILSAAMSSTASELNSLASTTALDLYRRNQPEGKSEKHFVKASKWFTLMWGALAVTVACTANLFDNLIQLVNIIGSIFYGNVLGIFLLAFFFKFIQSRSVFIAAIITQAVVIFGYFSDWMPYLWLNLFGCALVMILAFLIETLWGSTRLTGNN